MCAYRIFADSCVDMPDAMAKELGLEIIPLGLNLNGKTYKNYLDGREIDFKAFYAELRNGKTATTNAVNIGEYIEALEPTLAEGTDILLVAFSSALSTTYNSAVMATDELRAKYPERKILVVDSLSASMGFGLLMWYAANLQKEGKSMEEVRDWLEANKLHLSHWFTVDDLNHLKRGGRVSGATALIGTMLGIKPVLHVDNEGRLINVGKARGRKASLMALLDHMQATAIDISNQTVFLSHGDCEEEIQWLAQEIKNRFGVKEVIHNYIGPVIGAHSGAGTVAVFFLASER